MATIAHKKRYPHSMDRINRRLKIGAALIEAMGIPNATHEEVAEKLGGTKQGVAYEEKMIFYKILVRLQDIIARENLEGLKLKFDI